MANQENIRNTSGGADFTMLQPAEFDEHTSVETKKKLERLFRMCYVQLGGTRITVNLEQEDYIVAFEAVVNVYRRLRARSVFRGFGFLTLMPIQQVYKLNERVDVVRRMYRSRGLFGGIGAGVGAFESFGAATANILLRGGIPGQSGIMDLKRYDFMMQYMQTVDRLFAREMNFTFRNETHELILLQTPRVQEVVALDVSVLKRYEELINDHFAYDWIQKATLAQLKILLGEKYSLFATIPGAQGGSTLKGEALKQKGAEDLEKLENDLLVFSDSGDIPMPNRG